MKWLNTIQTPTDIQTIPREHFPELCQEIRDYMIPVVSKVGGHLASNLGVVELTVALHATLDCPRDKIIWDTSNQTYAHKLLTGRRDRFPTLRQFDGLSGFCKREESEFDTFNAGHAGTGVSATAGFSRARRHLHQAHRVVCVLGDGALTSGMTLEGLQHIGSLDDDVLVILNDNQMSISPNVGALSTYLHRAFTGTFCTTIRQEAAHVLGKIPAVGEPLTRLAKRTEELAKGIVSPGILFEELGFRYVGPIDGHNFSHLLPMLNNVLQLKGPTLLHVMTKKGLGYQPAMDNPVWFHACPPFDQHTGTSAPKTSVPSYSKCAIQALTQLAKYDENIVAITAAMCEGTELTGFKQAYPSRYYDVGIAEQHAVTFAAGLAAQGMRPAVCMYSTFLQRAYDQVVHDVATQNLPVTFLIDRGGLVAGDGTTHHGAFDYAYLRHIPNMVAMAPKDEHELQRMVATCLQHDGPAAVRYPRGNGLGVPLDVAPLPLPIGESERLQTGTDIALVAIGVTVHLAVAAARLLEEEGISVTVLNARFLKPLDVTGLVDVAANARCLLTVEEGCRMGGFGSAVLEALSEEGLWNIPTHVMGLPDWYIEQGPQDFLREQYGLSAQGIYTRAKELLTRATHRRTAQRQRNTVSQHLR